MLRLTKLLAVASLALLTACAVVPNHDYDTSYNFAAAKTYSWKASSARASDNPKIASSLLNDRLEAAFDKQMQAKGYSKVSADADLVITYHLNTDIHEKEVNRGVGMSFGFSSWSGLRTGMSTTTTAKKESPLALVTVELNKSTDGKLVWQASASEKLLMQSEPQKAVSRAERITEQLFTAYPL